MTSTLTAGACVGVPSSVSVIAIAVDSLDGKQAHFARVVGHAFVGALAIALEVG